MIFLQNLNNMLMNDSTKIKKRQNQTKILKQNQWCYDENLCKNQNQIDEKNK